MQGIKDPPAQKGMIPRSFEVLDTHFIMLFVF